MRIISEKEGSLRENEFYQDLNKERDVIRHKNHKLKHDIQKLIEDKKCKRLPNSSQDNLELPLSNRSSPDGQEIEMVIQEMSSQGKYKDTEALKDDQIRNVDFKIPHFKVFSFPDYLRTVWR